MAESDLAGRAGSYVHIDEKWVPYWKLKLVERGHFSEEKVRLTAWWLRLIEETVDEFLRSWQYDFDAVPFDYLDHPPTSMTTIKHNLHIIRTLLLATSPNIPNTEENKKDAILTHLRISLIEPLKRVIYSRLMLYVQSVKLMLWYECRRDLEDFQISLEQLLGEEAPPMRDHKVPPVKEFLERMKSRKVREVLLCGCASEEEEDAALSRVEEEVECLDSLFGDIAYIKEMQRLEGEFFKKDEGDERGSENNEGKRKQLCDIVPITGLILGRFHRLENELKTIIEHWSRKGKPPERKASGFGRQWVEAFLHGLDGVVKGFTSVQ